ncbi:MAG TPA: hypothetical protein DCZ74_06850, partial [Treponema sp.]|nr:hypothetical protein [Treponema sp.]
MSAKKNYTTLTGPVQRLGRAFALTFFALATLFFSSCQFWNEPVRDYFERWTQEVSIAKYELVGIESYTDKDGNLCIASDQDAPVKLFMINPYHYTNVVIASDDIETSATGTFPTITQNVDDSTLLDFTYGSDFLLSNECGGDIGATINVRHPMNGTAKEYTFSLKCNSRPPEVVNPAIMLQDDSVDATKQYYVLAFNLPTTDSTGGIHKDIESITINGKTYPITIDASGNMTFEDEKFNGNTPNPPLKKINKSFTHQANKVMYFYSGIPVPSSDEEMRAKTFTIGYTDKAGLKTTKTVEAKLPGIDAPTVKNNEGNTLTDGGMLNTLHINYDPDNVAYTTITLTLPEKDDIEATYEGGAINCKLYGTNGNEITIATGESGDITASSSTDSSTGTVTLKIHKEGDYTLQTFTKASGHSNSVTKTYKLKLAYADLDIPAVKKNTDPLSTSINNYIELDPDKNYSTVTISAPNTASFGPSVSGVSVEYKLYQGMTETENPDYSSSTPSTGPINLIDMTLGQWTLVVTATKTGYHSSTATYHIRPYASDLYVKSSNASGNPGSDTEGDGSQTKPYATIERCIQEIQVINKSTAEYTIHIIGTLTGAQTIDGGYLNDKAAKLTIKGEESTGILSGNSSAVPLSITTTVSIFIKDLKITGGSGNYGGGLVNQGTVTLQSGVEISGNSATSGGGISNSGTLTIESGVTISGNSATSGGGISNSGSLTIESGATINQNFATYGGGIYINSNNGCNVTINGGEIKGNSATDGGAIYNLASLTIKGGTISGNSAVTSGGGIYNAETLTMTGGTIGGSGNSDKNTVTGTGAAGGAIYQNGTFSVSGSAYVYPGTVNSNDVYLPSTKYVTVNAAYSDSNQSATNQMAITPATWKRGTQVLDGSQAANYPTYFKGSEADWTTIKDTNDSNKVKLYTGYTIWVAGTSPATGVGTPKTSANGGRGTKSKPYSSISEAVEQCWTTDKDFIIKLSGTITGTSQTIPDADSTNKTGLAKSITLEGVTGNTSDVIDRNLSSATSGGRALTISTTTPVTIKKIKITKGYTTSSGGGIYVSVGGASLT